MKNIPRIFAGNDIRTGMKIPVSRDVVHYLRRVMRTDKFLAFGGGNEFDATLADDDKCMIIGTQTSHIDPSGDITLYFALIKKTDDLINMATQMGVAEFQPVITSRTVAHNVNWSRMEKIAVEAAEQSNRNSVPRILPPIQFCELEMRGLVFADERVCYDETRAPDVQIITNRVLIGPEGGFSEPEFAVLDSAGAISMGLGKTILRAELAAVVALNQVMIWKK